MKRDMDLIRQILLEIEDRKNADGRAVEIDGVEPHIIIQHVELLTDAGFIRAKKWTPISGLPIIHVQDLTWEGHEFLNVLRNKTAWERLKSAVSDAEFATIPLSILKDVGVALIKDQLKKTLGLSEA